MGEVRWVGNMVPGVAAVRRRGKIMIKDSMWIDTEQLLVMYHSWTTI